MDSLKHCIEETNPLRWPSATVTDRRVAEPAGTDEVHFIDLHIQVTGDAKP